MSRFALMLALLAVVSPAAHAKPPEVVLALGGHDPVALCEGREVPGSPEHTIERGRYRYQFASAETRARFASDPDRYGIQLGGGCGKMGLLSGKGSPDRWWVHEGRIYVFASNQCRSAFQQDPTLYLESSDPPPQPTAAERKEGMALLESAARAMGGKRLDALATLRFEERLVYRQQQSVTEGRRARTFAFPDRYRQDESWGDWVGSDVLVAQGGFVTSGEEAWSAEPAEVGALERLCYRHPIAILKARRQPDFVARAEGAASLDGLAVEYVRVAYRGATTRLAIDRASGRIVEASYRGRGRTQLGELRVRYADFREVDGILWPFVTTRTWEGEREASPEIETAAVIVNPKLDDGVFTKPD
jgi:YHS domain-containing protein